MPSEMTSEFLLVEGGGGGRSRVVMALRAAMVERSLRMGTIALADMKLPVVWAKDEAIRQV